MAQGDSDAAGFFAGIDAETAAKKEGIHPRKYTENSIKKISYKGKVWCFSTKTGFFEMFLKKIRGLFIKG